jgi:hypothetical protein
VSVAAPQPSTAWRGWVAAGIAVLLAFLVFGVLADAFLPGPQGPPESSYATSPSGVAAWAELLTRAGHPVGQVRRTVAGSELAGASTLIVLGASEMTPAATRSLERFLRRGGRLVVGGGQPARVMAALLGSAPGWSPAGPRRFAVADSALPGVTNIVTLGRGSFAGAPGLLVTRRLGRGQLDVLADASPLENQLLARADNAQLALDLAGPSRRPVAFDEALHGYGQATGLAAIPARWWLTFAGLALAGGAWAVARGKRLGPPESPAPPAAPPRSDYVAAMTATLLRAHEPDRVTRLASEAARRVRSRSEA